MSSTLGWILALALGAAREECGQCTPAKLCAPHQAEESAALKELKPRLKDKGADGRAAGVREIAALDKKFAANPSKEIADVVAAALHDESFVVRTEAAKALADGMHPDVAVKELVAALEEGRTELAKLGGGRGGGFGGGFGGGAGGGDQPEDPKAEERRQHREEVNAYVQALVDGLAKMPDDRAVDALGELLQGLSRWNGELMSATAGGLLAHGSRKGVEAVIKKIKMHPPGSGGRFGGPDTTGKTLHDLLTRKVIEMSLEGAPSWSEDEAPDWDKWFAKNQKHFAAKLGKYDLERMAGKTE